MYDVTARRDGQHPGGEPVNAGKSAPVAAKAAAIDAAQARPLTWKTVVKRALAVAVAGAALYLALPKLIAVLGAWPRLSTLNPAWFTVCLAAELISFTCNFALQRLALRTKDWFPVVTAGLTGNAVTSSLPGGSAAGAAVQFHMLTTAGFDTDTAVGGLTAFSLLEVGGLLALPIFALPAILAGVPVSRGLVHTALLGIAAFVLYAIFGVIVLRADWPLATLGRVAQGLWNRVTRGHRPPVTGRGIRFVFFQGLPVQEGPGQPVQPVPAAAQGGQCLLVALLDDPPGFGVDQLSGGGGDTVGGLVLAGGKSSRPELIRSGVLFAPGGLRGLLRPAGSAGTPPARARVVRAAVRAWLRGRPGWRRRRRRWRRARSARAGR
jgi:hypothetical protein